MIWRRVIAVTLSAAVVLGAGLVSKAATLDAERVGLLTEAIKTQDRADAAEDRGLHLTGLIAAAEDETADLAAVLEVRPAFVAELAELATALSDAEGKVDTETQHAAAVATQETVLAERKDPGTIVAATATIRALAVKVDGEVDEWEAAQAAQPGPGGPRWSSSGADGYARVRAALDRVGGGGVGLYESSSCAGGNAPACANSDGYIKYRADIAGWSTSRLNWAMAHELAHIYQFRVWGALNSSGSYQSLFGGDPEFLANCMAVVRGFPGSVGCDAAQQAWASGIWVGAVR
ncbi:hypothetical protein [Microbacterium tumbae]